MASAFQLDIQKLYIAYFNRPADADGLAYWEKVVVDASGSTASVYTAFAASAEYKATFAGMDAPAIVNQIYTNLFNRPAEAAGLAYWADNLTSRRLTIDTIVKSVAEGAQLSDLNIFNNKVKVANAFTAALNTPSEVAAYTAPYIAPAAKAFISTIGNDASAAAALANIDATVLAVLQTRPRYDLTDSRDVLTGSATDDNFSASSTTRNLLQSDDQITGGGGNDRLDAIVTKVAGANVMPDTNGVETVAISGRAGATGVAGAYEVGVDAQRMLGVTTWESNNSTADVLFQSARIQNNQRTADITVAMVETAAGNVDMGVYFAPDSVRSATHSSTVLRLQLIDTRSFDSSAPIRDNVFNGFSFYFNGVLTTITSQAIDDAKTYHELYIAIRAAVGIKPGLSNIVVDKGVQFSAPDVQNILRTGTEITLTSTGAGDTISTDGPGAGWVFAPDVIPSAFPYSLMTTVQTSALGNAAVKVVLDDVGRGGLGGDLVIGNASTVAGAAGVGRFEVEVRDNSMLQTITSTNNGLREVILKNGATTSHASGDPLKVQDKGNLTVQGSEGAATANTERAALPGAGAQHGSYGFSDVRVVDGSLMTGKLSFDAEITKAAIDKYINLADFITTPAKDSIHIVYSGGANNDTIDVNIDGNVLASKSLMIDGKGDFTFSANGGAGNDTITVALNNAGKADSSDWYYYQEASANLAINAGEGNDVVRKPGAGNAIIDLGSGDDIVFAENTGNRGASPASWVFNTADQTKVGEYEIDASDARSLTALVSDTLETYELFNARLTVNYRGLTSSVTISSAAYKTSDAQINDAIIAAINDNPILGKLIVALKGPGNTLFVSSLIDGMHTGAELRVNVEAPTVSGLASGDVAAAGAAYGLGSNADINAVLAVMNTSLNLFNTNGDYVAQLAETGARATVPNVLVAGKASTSASDNIITGGLGNDVLVLGTAAGADAKSSSNDKLLYTSGQFGNDVVIHFTAGNKMGADQFNFTALGGASSEFAGTAISNAHGAITVQQESSANDSLAEIAALYTDGSTEAAHLFIAYDSENVGKVYSAIDGASGGVKVTLVGTIDLTDTAWSTLVAANFV